jgi:sporulation protein YtfJ
MGTHPIENIMQTTMESIRNMVDVNTIVGDTVVMGDGTVIIPISKVSFGFVAGGGEYAGKDGGGQQGGGGRQQEQPAPKGDYPFAGGSGAGVSVSPMAFLVVSEGSVQLLPVQFNNACERMLERVPDLLFELKHLFTGDHGDDHHGEGHKVKGKDREEEKPKHRWGRGGDETDGGAQDPNLRPAKDEL